MNLITEQWIPVRTHDGAVRHIRPAEVGNPDIAAVAFPRSDLNGAVTEFLIALLSTAAAPADEEGWATMWDAPPDPGVAAPHRVQPRRPQAHPGRRVRCPRTDPASCVHRRARSGVRRAAAADLGGSRGRPTVHAD